MMILRILIGTLLVPVSLDNDDSYQLNLKSWRFFFSWLLWTVLPSINLGYLVITDLLLELQDIRQDSGFANVSDHLFVQLDYFTNILSFWILPAAMGHLVSRFDSYDLLKLPQRKFEVFLHVLLSIITNCMFVLELTGINFIIGVYLLIIYFMQLTSSIFLVNVFTSSFIYCCQQFCFIKCEHTMIEESKRLFQYYDKIRTGLGPSLLFLYAYYLITLVYTSYWLTYDYKLLFCLSIVNVMMIIWNLTLSCQNCFDSLQLVADVLR